MCRKRRLSGLEFTIGYQAKMPLKKKVNVKTHVKHGFLTGSGVWKFGQMMCIHSELNISFRRTWLCQEKRTGNLYMDYAFKLNVTQVRSSRFC